MKILVLGADGMIGHKIAQILINHQYDIILNSRSRSAFLKKTFPSAQVIGFDLSFIKIKELLNNLNPELIINAVGITIRRGAEYDQTTNYINSILPHEIDLWCQGFDDGDAKGGSVNGSLVSMAKSLWLISLIY